MSGKVVVSNDGPWCDTCTGAVVFHEHWGWMHTDEERPKGIPTCCDPADHLPSAQTWMKRHGGWRS